MEECIPEQLTDLDVKHGELVHIIAKNSDGRWRCFVVRKQVRNLLLSLEIEPLCEPSEFNETASEYTLRCNRGSLLGT